MTSPRAFIGLLLITFALSLGGCGKGSTQKAETASPSAELALANCEIVRHEAGETKICGQPQRVIALDPHALDLLLALGVQPVGYAEDQRALMGSPKLGEPAVQVKYLGDRLTNQPTHVGTWQSPSLEAIVKLQPDLILGRIYDKSLYTNLSKISPTLFPEYSENDPWQDSIVTLGKVMDQEQRAKQVIEQHQQRLDKTTAELAPISRDSKLLLLSMSGLDAIKAFTDETYAGSLLKDLGFQLVKPQLTTSSEINLSIETLPQLKADRIIIMASGNTSVDKVKQSWQQNPILRSLPASQAGQVYFVDYQLWSRIEGPISAELMINQVRNLLRPG